MADLPKPPVTTDETIRDLRNQLNRAYLSGDGAAVERVMAQLAVAEQRKAA